MCYVFLFGVCKGVGHTEFHVAFSDGVSTVGPRYKAVNVREKCPVRPTWLTARIEGQQEVLDGQRILDEINTLVIDIVMILNCIQ